MSRVVEFVPTYAGSVTSGSASRSVQFGPALALSVPDSPAGNVWLRDPEDGTYVLSASARRAETIDQLFGLKVAAGTLTLSLEINGVPIPGVSALAVTAAPQDPAATSGNSVAVGDRVTMTLSAVAGASGLEFSAARTRV